MKTIGPYYAIALATLLIMMVGVTNGQQKEPLTLKIMSYNIHHGEGMDGVLSMERIAKIISDQQPDYCALQEVDRFCERTDSVDQISFLAMKTGMTGTFGKFMDYQGGEYGMASLTKLMVVSSEVLVLPKAKYEPRSTIIQEVEIAKGRNMLISNVHFDWISGKEGSENRMKQAQALVEYLNQSDIPALIIGDFNCAPDSPTIKYFSKQGFVFVEKGADNLSFQGSEKAEIDHVIYRDSPSMKFQVKRVELVVESVASDHRPLVVELEVSLN